MVIWTDKHKICQDVVPSTAEPADMMRFAQFGPVITARGPSAELAFASVKVTQLFDQLSVAMAYDAHKITSSFLCDTGWFITDKRRHSILIARQ